MNSRLMAAMLAGCLAGIPANADALELVNLRGGISLLPPNPDCGPGDRSMGFFGTPCWTQLGLLIDGFVRLPQSLLVGADLGIGSEFTDNNYAALALLDPSVETFPWASTTFQFIVHAGGHLPLPGGEVRLSGGLLLAAQSTAPETLDRLLEHEIVPTADGHTRLGGVFRLAIEARPGPLLVGFHFELGISNEVAFTWNETLLTIYEPDSPQLLETQELHRTSNSDVELDLMPRFVLAVPAGEMVSFAFEFGLGPRLSLWNEADRTATIERYGVARELVEASVNGRVFFGARFSFGAGLPGAKPAESKPAPEPDYETEDGPGGGG